MRLIWIYGPSCVGKKTAICEAANIHGTSWLRDLLDIKPPILPVIYGKGQTSGRFDYIDSVIYSDIDATVIIHGQPCDFSGYLDDKKGEAVYMMPDLDKHKERVRQRGMKFGDATAKWHAQYDYLKSKMPTILIEGY